MQEDRLKQLLHRADMAGGPVPAHPAVDAERLQARLARRRRQERLVVAAGAALMLGLGVLGWRGPLPGAIEPAVPIAIEAGPAELSRGGGDGDSASVVPLSVEEEERMAAEADWQLQIARRVLAARERARRQAQAAPFRDDPLDELNEILDTVAYRRVIEADQLREAERRDDEATVLYREVVQLFPQTSAAEVARERLAQMSP